jgi:hypothetical protein
MALHINPLPNPILPPKTPTPLHPVGTTGRRASCLATWGAMSAYV